MRASRIALVLLSLFLVGCPPPSAWRYLVVAHATKRGHALFDPVCSSIAAELHLQPIWHRYGEKWLCKEYHTGSVDIEIHLYTPANQMFVTIVDESGGHVSKFGRSIIERVRSATAKAAAPATVRETGSFEELERAIGQDIFGRCE